MTEHGRRMTGRWTRVLAVPFITLMIAAAVACIDTSGPPQYYNQGGFGGGASSGDGSGTVDSSLIGTWSLVVIDTVDGDATSNQTTWTFNGDGTFIQVVATNDLVTGTNTSTTATGTWSAESGSIDLTLQTPSASTESFSYEVSGDAHTLDSHVYQRTG